MSVIKRPPLEVADIFRAYSDLYIQKYRPPLDHLKVILAIVDCRTSKLGGHKESCSAGCGYERIAYNSCRNRHCPKCQFGKAAKWIENRQKELLDVPYFHVVFTLPTQKLLPVILPNKRLFYTLMFSCVSETLQELGEDPKWLGAKTGAICVLHTWTQRLIFHPHIHCIVPSGGLSDTHWMRPKNDGFLAPFSVLAKLFQGKLLGRLKALNHKGKLSFLAQDQHLQNPRNFDAFCQVLYSKPWVAYAKPSFKGPQSVLQYLGQYVHKIAISNWRLLTIKNDRVSFSYRDRQHRNIKKTTALHALDFMKLFLQHVLPYRFFKIRAVGFLANRCKQKALIQARSFISSRKQTPPNNPLPHTNSPLKAFFDTCPNCLKGTLVSQSFLPFCTPTLRPP
jgi:hypothetical protein